VASPLRTRGVALVEEIASRTTASASTAEQIEDLAEVGEYLSTLEELTGLLLEGSTLDELLTEVLDLFTEALEGCAAASITIAEGAEYRTAASTAAEADAVDALQYELREGPCVDALETGREHYVEELDGSDLPAAMRERARQHGFGSLFALPLTVHGLTVGAINLFSDRSRGFPPKDQELAWRLATAAAVTVANGRAYQELLALSEQLQTALDSRAVIEQAKGIIVARTGHSPEEAFELLRQLSQARNRKLRDVAAAIVAARGQVTDGS
jgi:transcriptional regulator with GAF, ATPase, and Fis domain